MENGFNDVHALHGGFDAWQQLNGAMEPKRGRSATTDERRDEQRA